MASAGVVLNTREWDAAIKKLPKESARAMVRSVNRAVVTTRTAAQRSISADLGIGSRVVRDALRIKNAALSRPAAQVITQGARIALYDFGAKQTMRGVRAKVRGERKLYPGTFLAKMASGHIGVFGRRGKQRLHIDERFVVSVPAVFVKRFHELQGTARDAFLKNLKHEFARALQDSAS